MESALVKASDIPFKISFYPQTRPKSLGLGGNYKKVVISCWSYLKASSHLPFSLRLSSLPTDVHMHTFTVQMPATICMLHLPHLSPNQHNPTLPHFSQNKLSPPACQNSREMLGPKRSLPASDMLPLPTPAQWSLSQLSTGICSVQVKYSALTPAALL